MEYQIATPKYSAIGQPDLYQKTEVGPKVGLAKLCDDGWHPLDGPFPTD